MKILVLMLLSSIAVSAFANGTWHGAYLGKGTLTNSCHNTSKEYVSTIDWKHFDAGTYFYYGLRFAASLRIVADDVILSASRKVVFGGSDLTFGDYESYEDCPGRDACEGFCCDFEEDGDSAATQDKTAASISLGVVNKNSTGGKTYPTKTEVRLKFKNGEKAYLSWIEPDKYQADINLEGKIILADGCKLTWQDKLVWHEKKPEAVQETLECLGGWCRWKKPPAGQNE